MTKLILDPRAFIKGAPQKVPVQPAVALTIAAALVIAFGAAVVCSSVAAPRDSKQLGAVLESFLEATSRGDFGSAYEYFSTGYRRAMSEERFNAEAGADSSYSNFDKLERTGLTKLPTSSQAPQEYSYRGRVTYEDGSTAALTATLVAEANTWKIDAIEFKR